ncbi:MULTISPECIES: copper transporter [Nocardia]|uniref:copper transporter n=1 Tax=Nocardia TaxID=1817 RepID=UPI000D6967D3|nr:MULTISPECIES: copper transporter [Nocardia]
MISFRQHAIAIVAIFLALAIGVVLGSQTLAADMLSGLRSDRTELSRRVEEYSARNRQLTDELNAADRFLAGSAGRVLGGTLTGRSVVVFTTPDADPADVESVIRGLETAGAPVTGRLALTDAFLDSGEGDRMRAAMTNVIPAGAQLRTGAVDQGSMAGDLLGLVLLLDPGNGAPRSTPQELSLVLETLRGGGFVAEADAPIAPAQLAVVITGNGAKAAENAQGANIARFTGALRGRGSGAILAGRAGAADDPGPIGVIRSDPAMAAAVTTVDNLDREIGRVTAVLGLTEQLNGAAGRYGTGTRATSLTLAAPPR